MIKAAGLFAIALAAVPVAAARPIDDVAIGAAFLKICVAPAPDNAAVRAAIVGDPNWASVSVPAELTLRPKGDGAQVETWRQTIDGHEVLLVLADDPVGKGLRHNCAFLIRDERPAMWYFRSVSDNLKAYGLKLKQQDIPHWRFHEGKFANGQRGQVELRSRSAGLPGKDVLHLAIAY